MALTNEQIEKLKAWERTKLDLGALTMRERALRAEVVAELFPAPTIGTNNLDLGNGYTLKFVKGVNYSLDKGDVDPNTGLCNTDRALDNMRSTGNDGAFVADRLVKWKPELSISEYKKLSDTHKKIIDKVITTSDASPELTIVVPPAAR